MSLNAIEQDERNRGQEVEQPRSFKTTSNDTDTELLFFLRLNVAKSEQSEDMEEKAHSKKLTSRSKQNKPQQQERITRSERQRRADNVVVLPEPTDMEVSKTKATMKI